MSQALVLPDGRLTWRGRTFRAALGRAGIRADKAEGDEATPAGTLALRRVLYRADRLRRPDAAVPIEPLAPDDGWCDDSKHADYNRMVTLPHSARHEALWRADTLYDLVGVLGWNDAPIVRERGSAIFLHVATHDYAPTQGCVALALPDLVTLLAGGVTELVIAA